VKPQAGVGTSRKKMLKTALFVQGGFFVIGVKNGQIV
jgi:hypothetical protein